MSAALFRGGDDDAAAIQLEKHAISGGLERKLGLGSHLDTRSVRQREHSAAFRAKSFGGFKRLSGFDNPG